VSSDTMVEEVETLDGTAHAPDDSGSDPVASQLVAGRGTDGSGGDSETPTRPRAPKRRPRKVRSLTLDDWLSVGGSVLASFALVYVGYLHLVDFSGTVGFAVCWYFVFLLVYGTVVAIANPRHIVTERLVAATLYLIAALVIFALATTVIYTFAEGWRAFVHINFFTHDMAGVSTNAPLNQGGIFHAIVGTVIMVGLAVVVAVPLGIGTAVYMTEVKGPGSHLIRTVVEAMTALSDILAGLFVYATLVVGFGLGKTGLAAAIAIAVTMLPLVARASEVALRVVPGGLREASEALGATHWKTTWKVVLPSARAGLVTAAILAIARGIGETAVVLVTTGASSFLNFNPVSEPMNSLPLYIYTAYETHEPLALTRAFGAASVLLAMVLLLFVVARWVVRDKSGRDGSHFSLARRLFAARTPFLRDDSDGEVAQ
jgi:phosphate transport system permease protein